MFLTRNKLNRKCTRLFFCLTEQHQNLPVQAIVKQALPFSARVTRRRWGCPAASESPPSTARARSSLLSSAGMIPRKSLPPRQVESNASRDVAVIAAPLLFKAEILSHVCPAADGQSPITRRFVLPAFLTRFPSRKRWERSILKKKNAGNDHHICQATQHL